MNKQPMDPTQLEELINFLIAENISDEQFASLSAELESNKNSRLQFIEHLNLHAELKRNFRAPLDEDENEMSAISRQLELLIGNELSDRPRSSSGGLFPRIDLPQSSYRSSGSLTFWMTTSLLLALLTFGVGFFLRHDWSPDQIADDLPGIRRSARIPDWEDKIASLEAKSGVAVLTQEVNAKWLNGLSFAPGQAISPGMIELESGLARIEFFCGATMILEGPARLEISDENTGFVHHGKLRVFVPQRAIGFTLRSKQCEVVDLGTEFAMDVGVNSDAEVHVIEGEVRVKDNAVGNSSPEKLLTTGKAVRFVGDANVEDIDSAGERFVGPLELKRISKASENKGFDRWREFSEQLKSDPSLQAFYSFQESSEWDRQLINSAPTQKGIGDGAVVGCQWTEGRWASKRALEFHQPSHRVRINIPGLFDAITLSTWVNLDELNQDMALTHPETSQSNFLHWTIDASSQRDRSGLHLAVTHVIDGFPVRDHYNAGIDCIGTTDLGTWLHIAVVYDPVARLVSHYKNGELVGSKEISHTQKIGIGIANLGNWPYKSWAEGTQYEVRNLNGRMDEFLAFSRVLSKDEIKEIFVAGSPDK